MFKLKESCHACGDAFGYNPGLVGKNYSEKKVMFVLNRSDSRALTGYEDAYLKTNTGKTVNKILKGAGLALDDIILTNFWKCLRPGDKESTKGQYANCRVVFEEQLKIENPKKIVLFGSPVYDAFCDSDVPFVEASGKVKEINGLDTYISYHPSGIRFLSKEQKAENFRAIVEYLKG